MFGSTVRDDNTPESDVDFLIDVSPEQTLLDLIAFTRELAERGVDRRFVRRSAACLYNPYYARDTEIEVSKTSGC